MLHGCKEKHPVWHLETWRTATARRIARFENRLFFFLFFSQTYLRFFGWKKWNWRVVFPLISIISVFWHAVKYYFTCKIPQEEKIHNFPSVLCFIDNLCWNGGNFEPNFVETRLQERFFFRGVVKSRERKISKMAAPFWNGTFFFADKHYLTYRINGAIFIWKFHWEKGFHRLAPYVTLFFFFFFLFIFL